MIMIDLIAKGNRPCQFYNYLITQELGLVTSNLEELRTSAEDVTRAEDNVSLVKLRVRAAISIRVKDCSRLRGVRCQENSRDEASTNGSVAT